MPSIPVEWAGTGKAWSVKVPPITPSTQRLCWGLAEALGKGTKGALSLCGVHVAEIFQAYHLTLPGVVNEGDITWRSSLLSNLELPLQSMEFLLGKISLATSKMWINYLHFSKFIPKNIFSELKICIDTYKPI